MNSLPVAFGVDGAKYICAATIDVTQLSVAAYLYAGLHEPIYAAVLLGLTLPQVGWVMRHEVLAKAWCCWRRLLAVSTELGGAGPAVGLQKEVMWWLMLLVCCSADLLPAEVLPAGPYQK